MEEKAMWRWRRHWSDAATARDRLEEARKGARLCRHLGSRPLASRSVTKMFTNFCCSRRPFAVIGYSQRLQGAERDGKARPTAGTFLSLLTQLSAGALAPGPVGLTGVLSTWENVFMDMC